MFPECSGFGVWIARYVPVLRFGVWKIRVQRSGFGFRVWGYSGAGGEKGTRRVCGFGVKIL